MLTDPSGRVACACAFLLCLAPLTVAAQDGPIEIRANGEYRSDQRRFVVMGDTDLPDHAILGLMVYFCGEAAPGAVARCEVKAGQFSLTYGPVERHVLAGVYELEVRYQAFDQVPSIRARLANCPEEKTLRISHYAGTRDQERQETRQYQDRLKDGLSRTRVLYGDLRLKADEYLLKGKEFREAEFKAWMLDWRSKRTGLQKLVDDIGPAGIFAPRFPESVRDLSVIASFLDLLSLHYVEQILRKNGINPQRIEVLEARPVFSLMVEEYICEIERRIGEMESRDAEDKEPTSFDLYRDLLDYQALFSNLLDGYEQARRDPDPATAWARRRPSWMALVDGFSARMARYKGSDIEGAHLEVKGGLSSELSALVQGLLDLEKSFGDVLAQVGANGGGELTASMKAAIDAIRARFGALYGIVLVERKAVVEGVEKRLAAFLALSDDLEAAREKAMKDKAGREVWAAWLPGWRDRLKQARAELAAWKKATVEIFHLPNAPRQLDTLAEGLSCLADLYDATLAGKGSDTIEERVKFNRSDVRDRMIGDVRAEVERAKKTQ